MSEPVKYFDPDSKSKRELIEYIRQYVDRINYLTTELYIAKPKHKMFDALTKEQRKIMKEKIKEIRKKK